MTKQEVLKFPFYLLSPAMVCFVEWVELKNVSVESLRLYQVPILEVPLERVNLS